MTGCSLSIVIPCYNERDNIPLLLEGFGQAMARSCVNCPAIEVVLVDNGSTDGSDKVIRELLPRYPFARTLRVEVNQGYGYGILQGLDSCRSDYIGWTHADLQTDPNDVIKAYSLITQEDMFVKGRRRGRPLSDQFFTTGMSVFESLYLGAGLYDINAQPNIFPRNFYESWKNPPYDFALDLYALYMAKKKKIKRVLIYTSPVFTSGTMPSTFNIDVTGVKVLRINYPDGGGYCKIASIFDGKLYNSNNISQKDSEESTLEAAN